MIKYIFSVPIIMILLFSGCAPKEEVLIVKNDKSEQPIYSNIGLFNRLFIKPFDNDNFGVTSKVYNSFLDSIFHNKPIIEKIYLVEKDFPKSEKDFGKFPILSGKILRIDEKVTPYVKKDIDNKSFKVSKQCEYHQFWVDIEYNLQFPTFIDSKIIKKYRQYDTCEDGIIDSDKIKDIMIQYNIRSYIDYVKKEFRFKDENNI